MRAAYLFFAFPGEFKFGVTTIIILISPRILMGNLWLYPILNKIRRSAYFAVSFGWPGTLVSGSDHGRVAVEHAMGAIQGVGCCAGIPVK